MNKKLVFSLFLAIFNVVLSFGAIVKVCVPNSALKVSYRLITKKGVSDLEFVDDAEKIISFGIDVKYVEIVCTYSENNSQVIIHQNEGKELITVTAQDWLLNGIHWTVECKKVGADCLVYYGDTISFYNDISSYSNGPLMVGYQLVNSDFSVYHYWTLLNGTKAKIRRENEGQIVEFRCGKSMISFTGACGGKTVAVTSNEHTNAISWSIGQN